MNRKDFEPTHTITTVDQHGKRRNIKLMEVEGSLYTRQEWLSHTVADWEIDKTRTVTFHDGPAPAGVVRWSIKTLSNARPAASSLEA